MSEVDSRRTNDAFSVVSERTQAMGSKNYDKVFGVVRSLCNRHRLGVLASTFG